MSAPKRRASFAILFEPCWQPIESIPFPLSSLLVIGMPRISSSSTSLTLACRARLNMSLVTLSCAFTNMDESKQDEVRSVTAATKKMALGLDNSPDGYYSVYCCVEQQIWVCAQAMSDVVSTTMPPPDPFLCQAQRWAD
eukprot:scaffold18086_cov95-Skeletonema_marinoi.AAC.1